MMVYGTNKCGGADAVTVDSRECNARSKVTECRDESLMESDKGSSPVQWCIFSRRCHVRKYGGGMLSRNP